MTRETSFLSLSFILIEMGVIIFTCMSYCENSVRQGYLVPSRPSLTFIAYLSLPPCTEQSRLKPSLPVAMTRGASVGMHAGGQVDPLNY